jgi:hypothetical protein
MTKKIEFFSTIPGLAETFPVVPAKDFTPSWLASVRMDYMKSDKRDPTIVRCPGIMELFTTGYILTAWHDFDITCTQEKITVILPDKKLVELLGRDTIQIQDPQGIAKHIPKRPWSQKAIVKINTPWNIIAPKGVKFLMIPLPYTESFEFESNIGILDPGYSTELNAQGYWNIREGTHTIKAGTPIAQIIPMSEDTFEMVCRDMNEYDSKWITKQKFYTLLGFVLQRNKIKAGYEKHVENSPKCPFHFWKK